MIIPILDVLEQVRQGGIFVCSVILAGYVFAFLIQWTWKSVIHPLIF